MRVRTEALFVEDARVDRRNEAEEGTLAWPVSLISDHGPQRTGFPPSLAGRFSRKQTLPNTERQDVHLPRLLQELIVVCSFKEVPMSIFHCLCRVIT